jgi:hypothetical protein
MAELSNKNDHLIKKNKGITYGDDSMDPCIKVMSTIIC